MKNWRLAKISPYILVTILSVGGAFLVSLHFLKALRAQESKDPAAAAAAAALPANQAAVPAAGQAPPNRPATSRAVPPPAAQPGQAAINPQVNSINELDGFLEPFIYDIANRRDPFQPYGEFIGTPGGNGGENGGRPEGGTLAQRWELERLKLIGIMWDVKDPKAMFLNPEEDVMILGRDESIGNKNGYIATIREGEVVVVEAIRKRGDTIYRTRVLRIER